MICIIKNMLNKIFKFVKGAFFEKKMEIYRENNKG